VLADGRGEGNHRGHGNPVVELLAPHQRLPRPEINVKAQHGTQERSAGPRRRRNIPHIFWNASPEPAHLVEIISPAGFENVFAELGKLAATCPPEEFADRRADLARGYDHYFVHPEWVPELQEKYGLKLLGEE
jgi:hypothetical protein